MYALLYPFVLSPVFAIVEMPDAVVVAHGWNAMLFASSAIPAYLLARTLGLSAAARLLAGVFAVVIPWTVIAGFLMTESAAYPASLWAAYLIQRAAVRPGDGTYALALGAIALAILARPQLIVLAVALVAAALTVELRERRGWAVHRVLVGAVAFTLLVFVLLAATARSARLSAATRPRSRRGAPLAAALRSSIVHLDVVAVAIGLVPSAARRRVGARSARAPAAANRAARVRCSRRDDGRILVAPGRLVRRTFCARHRRQDRYLFTSRRCSSPPRPALEDLVRGSSARLRSPPGSCSRSGGSSSSPCSASTSTPRQLRPTVAHACSATLRHGSPPAADRRRAGDRARTLPRTPLAYAVLAVVTLFCALETAYTWDRLLASSGLSARPLKHPPPDALSWVDANAPGDAVVGMLPYSVGQEWCASAIAWWDVEFWNARVQRGFLIGKRFTYVPALSARSCVSTTRRVKSAARSRRTSRARGSTPASPPWARWWPRGRTTSCCA